MQQLLKTYQLWTFSDNGYHLQEFDSLEECLEAQKYTTDWYITKKVDYYALEK